MNECPIHDCNSAVCPSCKHRGYFFSKNKTENSPEEITSSGLDVVCEFCGGLLKTVDMVTPQCNCKRCIADRRQKEELGLRVNFPLRCRCNDIVPVAINEEEGDD